jgi:hypothetical protein
MIHERQARLTINHQDYSRTLVDSNHDMFANLLGKNDAFVIVKD